MIRNPLSTSNLLSTGSKIGMSADTYKLIDSDGTNIRFKEGEGRHVLSESQLDMLRHAKQCHDHCRELESTVEKLHAMRCENKDCGNIQPGYFPLIIGRRPSTATTTSPSSASLSGSSNVVNKPTTNAKPPEIKGYVR